ncbi:MAG TPA: LytR C-terminal domain-containing protein [Candidatus Nanopelagicales bacterium]|nr:LytR C-terminal domain-containing protein [Candidatus Nanopelagicales bacterium]
MTTYSGEDGMTGTDEPTPYGADPAGPSGPTPGAEDDAPFGYQPGADEAAHDDTAYNATDVLPVGAVGGRQARRRAAEEQARAATPPAAVKKIASATPSGPGRAIVPLALALVSGVALAAGWLHLESDRTATAEPPGAAPSASASPTPTPSPSLSTSSTPSPSTSPTTAPSVSPSAVSPAPSTTTKPVSAVDRSVPVVVLNATGKSGLAAKVAAKLRADGWKVTSVGNWTKGGIAATTIYLNGHVAARDTMVKDLPAADGRVEFPLAGMPKLRLVVVVGKDYPA